jgi:hypothetical protein
MYRWKRWWNRVCRGGTFLLPCLCGLVISACVDRLLAHIVHVANGIMLNDGGGEFEI